MNKIAVIGPGAIGGLFAARIKKSGFDVILIDKEEDRCAFLNENGISIEGVSGEYQVKVPCIIPDADSGPFDLVIVCVKAYETDNAVEMHKKIIGPETSVLTLQNGYGNVDAIKRHVSEAQIIAGITSQGANIPAEGKINHAGTGDTFIGGLSGEATDRIKEVAAMLDKSGFPTAVSDNVNELIFTKLLINVGINALTGIFRVRNGKLNDYAESRELMSQAVAEGLRVAEATGVNVDREAIQNRVAEVATLTAQNRSSMLMDILNQRKTEIEFINGAIVKLGAEEGISTPVNQSLTNIVRVIEQTYDIFESL